MEEYSPSNKRTPLWRLLLWAAISLMIFFSLKCRLVPVEVPEGLTQPWRFLAMLSDSCYLTGITDVLALASVFLAIRFVSIKGIRRDGWTMALAAAFGVLYVFALKLSGSDKSFDFFFAGSFQVLVSLLCMFGYFLLFYLLLQMAFYLMVLPEAQREGRPWRYSTWLGFLLILICWLPWTIVNYPGSFAPDAELQLAQYLGGAAWSTHHPPLSSAIMGLCLSLGMLIRDANLGCYLYILLQTVLGALVFSFTLKKLNDMGAEKGFCVAGLLFFALVPMWGCYAQWFEKDLLYAEIAAFCTVCIAQTVYRRRLDRRSAATLAVAALAAALLRNNGIYEFAPALVLLVLCLKKADRRRMLAVLCAVLFLFEGVTRGLYPALGIERGSIREMLSIPFQQTALYVNYFGDEVTPEERAVIDSVLTYDELDKYDPVLSDPVKSGYRGDDSKLPEYFGTWFRMFLKHPAVYVEAFLLISYGFFAPVDQSFDAHFYTENSTALSKIGVHHIFDGGPTQPFERIRELSMNAPLSYMLLMPGLYTWILLACFVLLLRSRKLSALIPIVPGLINFLVCLASPRSTSMRYALPMLAVTPFIIGWTRVCVRGNNICKRRTGHG